MFLSLVSTQEEEERKLFILLDCGCYDWIVIDLVAARFCMFASLACTFFLLLLVVSAQLLTFPFTRWNFVFAASIPSEETEALRGDTLKFKLNPRTCRENLAF